jgi:hypothetical protein
MSDFVTSNFVTSDFVTSDFVMPVRALHLIKEYVRPVTRPDWRTFERPINPDTFITQLRDLTILHKSELFMTAYINMRHSEFHTMHTWIEFSGVDSYIYFNGGCREIILSNRWLAQQQRMYDGL